MSKLSIFLTRLTSIFTVVSLKVEKNINAEIDKKTIIVNKIENSQKWYILRTKYWFKIVVAIKTYWLVLSALQLYISVSKDT